MWFFLALAIPTGLEPLSDEELLDRFHQSKDSHCLLVLVQRYQAGLVARYRRFAEDELSTQEVVNELLLLLYERLPRVKEVKRVRGLLFTIVQRHLIDLARRKKVHQDWEEAATKADQERLRLAVTEREALSQRVAEADLKERLMAQLNEMERTCLELYLQGYRYREIMDQQALSFNQVRGAIQRSLQKMRQDPVLKDFFD